MKIIFERFVLQMKKLGELTQNLENPTSIPVSNLGVHMHAI